MVYKNKKIDIQKEITDKIIRDLEAGQLPWGKPWITSIPKNFSNGKAYRGINVLVLMGAQEEAGYKSSQWITYNQALEMGGVIRKGEEGVRVVFNQPFTKETENDEGETVQRKQWFMRYYTVFNLEQTEGLEEKIKEQKAGIVEEHIDAEEVVKATKARIEIGGDRACYTPSLDYILMPNKNKFLSTQGYYGVLFHELVHWTGHDSRLKRKIMNEFGSEKYAEEELVAEMGAAFICGALQMPYTTNHAAYVQDWLKVLKNDKRAIFKAAGHAQKAMDMILKTKVEMIEAPIVKGETPLKKKRKKRNENAKV